MEGGKDKWHGWFHGWGGTSERAYALIEDHDGRVHDVKQEGFWFEWPPRDEAFADD